MSSHGPLSITQFICFFINRSSFNICPDTNFFASHFAWFTLTFTLSRKLGVGGLRGTGFLCRAGLGRPRPGGGCLGKGRFAVGSGPEAAKGAIFETCRDSCGISDGCCLPNYNKT